jgi:hypothetical protein
LQDVGSLLEQQQQQLVERMGRERVQQALLLVAGSDSLPILQRYDRQRCGGRITVVCVLGAG